jgi:cell division protein FtsB
VLAALLLASTGMLAKVFWGADGLPELRRLWREQSKLREEVERLEARKVRLRREVGLLQDPEEGATDEERAAKDREIERRARRDLGMLRPGETIFLLPERQEPER